MCSKSGWAFPMPQQFDQFSWNRQANWTVYPDTHIARPVGTAKPDSADVSYAEDGSAGRVRLQLDEVRLQLRDAHRLGGKGLRVEFAENDRHHCRGGIGKDGYTLFVNKRVCSPEDLSSNVVPEQSLKLKNGD